MSLAYLYIDTAGMAVDFAVDPPAGAVGSNWQVRGEFPGPKEARGEMAAQMQPLLDAGYSQGHDWAPTY